LNTASARDLLPDLRALRSTAGLLLLSLRLHRLSWITNVTMGLLVPLLGTAALVQGADPALRVRMWMGACVLSTLLLCLRRQASILTFDRVESTGSLIAAHGIARVGYLTAHLVDAALLGSLPVLALAGAATLGVIPAAVSGTWWVPLAALAPCAAAAASLIAARASDLGVAGLLSSGLVLGAIVFCPVYYEAEPGFVGSLFAALPPGLAATAAHDAWVEGQSVLGASLFIAAWQLGFIATGRPLYRWPPS